MAISKAAPFGELREWRCCMVKALLHGLPGSLDKLCGICKVPQDQAKEKDGKRLIHLFCKPRPKNMKLRRATRAGCSFKYDVSPSAGSTSRTHCAQRGGGGGGSVSACVRSAADTSACAQQVAARVRACGAGAHQLNHCVGGDFV
jgi:hypothetical protein